MANLFELLTNAGNKIKTGLQNNAFLNNLTQRTPYIEDSNAEWDKSIALEEQKAKDEAQFAQRMQRIQNNPNSFEAKMYNLKNNLQDFNLADALLGKQATPTDSMSSDGNSLQITTSQNPRTGGILRDIAGGFQENRFTPASLENLGQNTLLDGRQKGFAYKLGEGLGSVARLANSPLGRGLIVGGLVGATGGNPLQALAYGGGATMLNQQNVMKDRAYRNQLYQTQADKINGEYEAKIAEIENDNTLDNAAKLSEINTLKADQQQALQNAQNQIYGMRGYMGDALFGNILRQQQLKDNAEYRKMYFDVNQANMQADREYKKEQDALNRAYQEKLFNYKASQDAFDNYIASESLKAKQQEGAANATDKGDTTFQQLQLLEDAFANMPQSKEHKGLQKSKAILTGATNLVGLRNDNVTAYEAIRNPLVTTLARSIAGEKGVLTDKDFARAEKMVPTAFDSPEQAQAKFEQIKKLVGVKYGTTPTTAPQTASKTQSVEENKYIKVGKYKARVK